MVRANEQHHCSLIKSRIFSLFTWKVICADALYRVKLKSSLYSLAKIEICFSVGSCKSQPLVLCAVSSVSFSLSQSSAAAKPVMCCLIDNILGWLFFFPPNANQLPSWKNTPTQALKPVEINAEWSSNRFTYSKLDLLSKLISIISTLETNSGVLLFLSLCKLCPQIGHSTDDKRIFSSYSG